MRASSFRKGPVPVEPGQMSVSLVHDERHLRRRLLTLADGSDVLVDLAQPVALEDGDALVLEDGRLVRIAAAPQALHAVHGTDPIHLAALCWHIGNRHLPAQIVPGAGGRPDHVLILKDHVIRAMLEGLGARVTEVTAPFVPLRGAYAGPGHRHGHG